MLTLRKRLRDIAVNNTTHDAVAVADKADELTRIRLTDHSSATVALPARPRLVAIDSGLNLAVVGLKAKHLRFVDLAPPGAPVLLGERVALPDEPEALAVDSTRRLTLALTDTKRKIHFVDNASRTLLASLALAEDAEVLALHPGRGLAYVATEKKQLLLVGLDSRAIRQRIALPFRANAIAVDEALDLAVLTTDDHDRAYVLDLASIAPGTAVLPESAFAQVHRLPKRPGAVAIQPETHVAVVLSKESDAVSTIDLATGIATPAFVGLEKPFALAVTSRYNQALVLSAERDEVAFVQLSNPLPLLEALIPSEAAGGSPVLRLTLTGKRFIDSSRAEFGGTGLTTRFLTPGRLEAEVPASLLANARSVAVTVRNPPPAGGLSNALSFVVTGAAPVLTTIVPSSAPAGGSPKLLALTGQHFVARAVVLFGQEKLPAVVQSPASLTVTVPGTLTQVPGVVPVAVLNPSGQLSNSLPFTLTPALAITGINPTSGPPGIAVAITGTGFEPTPAGNTVTFAGGALALVTSATATQLVVVVPAAAQTGPITVTNSRGSAQSPIFTVVLEQDFNLVASPATLTVLQNATVAATLQLASTGTRQFTGLARLSALNLPAGVSAAFSPQTLSASQTGQLTFGASASATPGAYLVQLKAEFSVAGKALTRIATINLTVQSGQGVTGVQGRFVTPEGNGIAGILVRADINPQTQPQTVTDAAGNFLLVALPPGAVTLRMDATPANPLYPIWPYTATLAANQITLLPDWTIAPPPPDERFTPIANATQDQKITDARFPGLEITLPAGVTITGWDNVRKTRIAVERHDPDKLSVSPPPLYARSTYQLYFGTPMGGIPSAPIPVTVPNDLDLEPGEQAEIFFFDGAPTGAGVGEWRRSGTGTVSPDGARIVSDAMSGIPRFCGVCGAVSFCRKDPPSPRPPPAPKPCDPTDCSCRNTGAGGPPAGADPSNVPSLPVYFANPVAAATGVERPLVADFACGGRSPIALLRTYNPVDAFNGAAGTIGSLGFGWVWNYDIALLPFAGLQKRIVLPGDDRVNFVDEGRGTYRNAGDRRFDGALMRQEDASTWRVDFKDGRAWRFKPFPGITGLIRGGPPFFLVEKRESDGRTLFIARNALGRITSVGTPERAVTMRYGTNGFVSEVRDPLDRLIGYGYNANGRIETVTDPDGGVTRYSYVDDTEFAQLPACPRGYVGGERIKTIQRPGQTALQSLDYGPAQRVLRETLEDGSQIRFAYTLQGACVTHVDNPALRCSAGNCPSVDSWENFAAGWRIVGGSVVATTVTDAAGRTVTQRFSAGGLGAEQTDGLGQSVKLKRDAQGRVVDATDALGRATRYAYDEQGNVIRTTDALGRLTELAYDGRWNKPSAITRFLAGGTPVVRQLAYDVTSGNLVRTTDPLGQTTHFTYTPQGLLETITSPLNQTTRFAYNPAGDLVTITDPLGNETHLGRDGVGRATTATEPRGFDTRFAYSPIDQLAEITDANLGLTRFNFDAKRDLTSVVNPLNRTIEANAYDALHRLTRRTDAKGRSELLAYDPAGNLTQFTDRKGQATRYAYDDRGQLIRIEFGDASVQTRAYDAVGRLTEMAEGDNVHAFAYDALDRVVRVTQESAAGRAELRYAYDALDRRTQRTLLHNGTLVDETTYRYDNADRLLEIGYVSPLLGVAAQTSAYTWDAASRLIAKRLPNGITQLYTWDEANRLLRIEYRRPDTSVLETVAYTYDAAGNRTSRTTSVGSRQDTPYQAAYDETNRLTSLTLRPGTAQATTFTLGYDDNGNLATKTEQGTGALTRYSWDARDRLVRIEGPALTAEFKYDALGRRVSRTVNGVSGAFVYDGRQAIGEVRNGQLAETLLSGLAIDEVIARYSQTGNRTYLTDALGSVFAQTRADASVVNFYAYSPYGESSSTAPDEGNAIQYTARENDGTGLYYYRARYYDPVLKRFISEDPAGMEAGTNVYSYVGGMPTMFIDPTGRIFFVPIIIAAIAAGGSAVAATATTTATIMAIGGVVGGISGALAAGATGGLLRLRVPPRCVLTWRLSRQIGSMKVAGSLAACLPGR